jgi:excisionase family DNA binding protein
MDKLTLSNIEAAKLLGISRNAAYQLAKEGRLPVIKFGRLLLVPCETLNEILDSCINSLDKYSKY